jgi:hypothetical protein
MSDLIDDLPIQRCIDGELPEAAQQELLRQLDGTADGWKRLALAFVEKQVWAQSCEQLSAATKGPENRLRPAVSRISARTQSRWIMAASALLSLSAGIGTGMWLMPRPVGQRVAQSEKAVSSVLPGPGQTSNPPIASAVPVSHDVVIARPAVLELPLTSDDEVPQSVQIPVFDAGASLKQTRQQRLLTKEQVESLRRMGYEVDRQRKLLAVPVKGGSEVLVPVESYGIRYAVQ